MVHPSCSTQHLGVAKKLHALAAAMADDWLSRRHPPNCCGFAGDRGFLHPELTQAATAEEAAEVGTREFDAYLGSNRTCEIGLNLATGRDYESFVFLLDELTRPLGSAGSDTSMKRHSPETRLQRRFITYLTPIACVRRGAAPGPLIQVNPADGWRMSSYIPMWQCGTSGRRRSKCREPRSPAGHQLP